MSISLKKYKDYHRKTDQLLDDNFPCDSTNFEGNWKQKHDDGEAQLTAKLNNDLLSETSSAEANFKFKRDKKYDVELVAKSDGSRTAKFSTEKIPQVKKVKLCTTYNPWIDIFNVNCEAEYKHKQFISNVVAHYGRKTGLEAIASFRICQSLVLGLNGYFDLKKNTLSTYNFLAAIGFSKHSHITFEHQSVPGDKFAFGNWMVRAFYKPYRMFRFGARVFYDSESKDAAIEFGGRYRMPTVSLYWKFMQDGNGFLGVKSELGQKDNCTVNGRLGYQFNFAKRNIFEDPGKFGFSLNIKNRA